jgi:nucleotide-binding universal stress UspA family protein
MRRVLVTSGRLGVSVFGPIEHNPATFALVRALASAAGFQRITIMTETRTVRFASVADYVRIQPAATPLASLLRHQPGGPGPHPGSGMSRPADHQSPWVDLLSRYGSLIRGKTMTGTHNGDHKHRIVVGVDGSISSKAALAWAIRQAGRTGATVDAVTAWEFPAFFPTPWPPSLAGDFKDLAERVLAETIAEVSDHAGQVEITPRVMEGNAAQVLVDASAGADLLVVGNRGHGGFAEALLGSIGQHCVHHSECPVVVIRDSLTGSAGATGDTPGSG